MDSEEYQSGRIVLHAASSDTLVDVSVHRYFSAHHMMLGAATAVAKNNGSPHNAILVIAMCAMGAEALANAVGQLVFAEWEDFDKLSPWGKYRLICRELQIPCEKGKGVWQKLYDMLKLRNDIAHAKPERVSYKETVTMAMYNAGLYSFEAHFPDSKLEHKLMKIDSKECITTLETVMTTLADALTGMERESIAGDVAVQEIAMAQRVIQTDGGVIA